MASTSNKTSASSSRGLDSKVCVAQLVISAVVVFFTATMLYSSFSVTTAWALLSSFAFAKNTKSTSSTNSLQFSPLRFTTNNTFQITIFEDLHYGEAEDLDWGPEQDTASERVMNTVLDYESPQLVVLNGDLITGENTYKENSSAYVDEIVRPLVERDLAWASTYGNHDSQYNLSRSEIYARERRYPNSLTGNSVTSSSDDVGITNYYLPVFSNDESNTIPQLILWFFDSRGGYAYQETDVSIPQWVHPDVVDWFTSTSTELQAQYSRTIPSLAFFHIPVYASLAFQNEGSVDPNQDPGINDDVPLDSQGDDDNGTYIGGDVPFMSALISTNGLLATFSGHDHGDDWCFKWTKEDTFAGLTPTGGGINLCFGRHSGYGGYGTWMRGARQVLVSIESLEECEIDTWTRLEDTTISGSVTLNSTYGEDLYPTVPEKYTDLDDQP